MEELLVRAVPPVLHITLNRPQALNALTLAMVRGMTEALLKAAADPTIEFVLVDATGPKAFCAGGDIRKVAQSAHDPAATDRIDFFIEEYRLNHLIHTYPKPYIALIDGVVMGGGVGVSIHGIHRIVTERVVFAMPETGIGLIPDVGGTYFLPRFPGEIGTYLGLTGARLEAADALYAGYASKIVSSAAIPTLTESLLAAKSADVTLSLLERFTENSESPILAEHRAEIDRCFDGDSVETIIENLHHEANAWADNTVKLLKAKSPMSLKLTLAALRRGAHLPIEDCLTMEFHLVQKCIDGDFPEGVRALLIDKDQTPHWRPSSLEEISQSTIENVFNEPRQPLAFSKL